MELAAVLHRSPKDRRLPVGIFVPIRAAPRRPRIAYRIQVRSTADIDVVRRRGLAMYLLTSDVPTRHHYPMRFPPVLFVDRRLAGLVDAPYRVVPFRAPDALRDPSFEALVTMMLQVDEIAARVMLVRNPRFDPSMLTRLVVGERLERSATLLGFQQFAPGIPLEGPSMPLAALRDQDRRNPG